MSSISWFCIQLMPLLLRSYYVILLAAVFNNYILIFSQCYHPDSCPGRPFVNAFLLEIHPFFNADSILLVIRFLSYLFIELQYLLKVLTVCIPLFFLSLLDAFTSICIIYLACPTVTIARIGFLYFLRTF